MKAITEAILRDQLRASQPESYQVPEGKILSPAAREYLRQRKIEIVENSVHTRFNFKPEKAVSAASSVSSSTEFKNEFGEEDAKKQQLARAVAPASGQTCVPKYVDYTSGAFFPEKPEHMTQLVGNKLVPKDHLRIYFRGRLDSLQSHFVLTQAIIAEGSGSKRLIDDLNDVLGVLREIMRCDVLDEPFVNDRIIGLTHEEIRERSHNPMKFYSIKQMVLPDYSFGKVYALLNELRTAVRETEVAAVRAFRRQTVYERRDIVETLNRLSSVMHIMMCMYLADEYKK